MRIVIDLQGAQSDSRFRGIGRYSLSLAKAIADNRGSNEVIIVLNGLLAESIEYIRSQFIDILPQENIRVWYAPGPVHETAEKNQQRRDCAELIRENFLASLNPDIIHISSLFEGYGDNAVTSIGRMHNIPVSVSFYDLIPLLNADKYLTPNPTYNTYYLRKIEHLKKASLLLAISDFSKREGQELLIEQAGRFVNISSAVGNEFRPQQLAECAEQDLRNKFSITRSFVLYTGGADERKNLPRLIRSYASLPAEVRKQYQMVFAGMMGLMADQLRLEARKAGLADDELIFTGYITDEEIIQLYNISHAYVFPSWHEGFGLPALEAMSCGVPVIASNRTSLPEVLGHDAALFDPFDEAEITKKLFKVLVDNSFRLLLMRHQTEQAKKFSWDNSAKTAIEAFKRTIAETRYAPPLRVPSTRALVSKLAEQLGSKAEKEELIRYAHTIGKNHPRNGLKQFFVDVSELSQRSAGTGVQRVTSNVLLELLNAPPIGYKIEPVYADQFNNGYRYAREYTAKLMGFRADNINDESLVAHKGDVFFGLDLQHDVVLKQERYFEQLSRLGVELTFVVYDLLPIQFSHYFHAELTLKHGKWLELISRFTGLICISNTVANEVTSWLSERYPERLVNLSITSAHLGCEIDNSMASKGLPDNAKSILGNIQTSTSFLMVSTIEPRKGQELVLTAFEKLWQEGIDIKLVLVGKAGWLVDTLIKRLEQHEQRNQKLIWLSNVSDEYLEEIYAASSSVIAASEGEGFGLPLIEAARHQLPIIARDTPIFREVAGEHAYYTSALDARDFADSISCWLALYEQGKHPLSVNMPCLSWKQSTDKMVANILASSPQQPSCQLFVDISELVRVDARSGIQRVVRSILNHLYLIQDKGELFTGKNIIIAPVYSDGESSYRYAHQFMDGYLGKHLESERRDDYIEYQAGDIFLGLDYQPQFVVKQANFYQQMCRHGVDVRFVIYDLLSVKLPHFFPIPAKQAVSQWLEVVTQSDGALCISKSVADDLKQWMASHPVARDRPFKVDWFHLGADVESSNPTRGFPQDGPMTMDKIREVISFLMVGTVEPRKGIEQTLTAFELLWQKNTQVNLVLVGKQGWMVDELINKLRHHPELGKRLFWLEGVSDEYLEATYGACSCLIAASEGEGFGLPLIEAAQHELPIIARDIPVFREVAGEFADYFQNSSEPEIIATCIELWVNKYQKNEHIKSSVMPWMTWEQSTKKLLYLIDNSDDT